MSGGAVCLRGDAFAAAILALRLLGSDPDVQVFVPLDGLLDAEGEVFESATLAGHLPSLVTCEWSGYYERIDGDLVIRNTPVAYLDPVQAFDRLESAGVKPADQAPADAESLDLPRFDPLVRPSQMLGSASGYALDRPILSEPSDSDEKGRYDQVLPFSPQLVMIRRRIARGSLFATQNILLGRVPE